ncbi:sodium:calcium antiporter [Asticcacaulis sp. EMRT-3]|uniref:sodium:calcium antiporter n=1 Tax=Asticcacaulis sp. EMRT-3 TaxID=3040349 RepID=UPI0024AF8824|nr:sodium:calcium antiporter [Asticcacaulis sp. EMRT-3]MDI7776305.1 sodium:calcium antiporter [Asticcacaulis sp. EMRT-3]
MLLTLILFIGSAVVIYLACEYFTNSIEWCGKHLNFGATAVGSVLAAFGTALPESAVTFTAVVFGHTARAKDIGVGAAMGGPLVLATIAYGVVGLALWLNRRKLGRRDAMVQVEHGRLSRDQLAFLAIFVVKVGLGLVAFAFKPWLGVLFLAAYALYVWREITAPDESDEGDDELEPLKLRPGHPSLLWASLQAGLSLLVIAFASHLFVAQLEQIGEALHMAPHLVALLLSPVATELPETMNAIIWVRQGKERLALANISGAMMIQATIPSALGIFFTPWRFDHALLAAGIITAAAIIVLFLMFRRGRVDARALTGIAALYGVFALWLVFLPLAG